MVEFGRARRPLRRVIARNAHALEVLERAFRRAGRILVPSLTDWTQTSKVVCARHGYEPIEKGTLTNDALTCDERRTFWNNSDNSQSARFWETGRAPAVSVTSRKTGHQLRLIGGAINAGPRRDALFYSSSPQKDSGPFTNGEMRVALSERFAGAREIARFPAPQS